MTEYMKIDEDCVFKKFMRTKRQVFLNGMYSDIANAALGDFGWDIQCFTL